MGRPTAESRSGAIITSWRLPGAISRTRGLPEASVKAWIWSYGRPANDRWLPRRPPFSARGGAMRLDVGAINRSRADHSGTAGERLEQRHPDTLPAPAIEAIVDSRVGTVVRWAVSPACA